MHISVTMCGPVSIYYVRRDCANVDTLFNGLFFFFLVVFKCSKTKLQCVKTQGIFFVASISLLHEIKSGPARASLSVFLQLTFPFSKFHIKKRRSWSAFKVEFNCCSVFLRDGGVNERSSRRSSGTQTVSSRLKYLRRTTLRPCPIHLMHCLVRTSGLALDVLLMSYRFSLLP